MALTASPQLLTERLDLRVPTVDDLPAILAIATDPETAHFTPMRDVQQPGGDIVRLLDRWP